METITTVSMSFHRIHIKWIIRTRSLCFVNVTLNTRARTHTVRRWDDCWRFCCYLFCLYLRRVRVWRRWGREREREATTKPDKSRCFASLVTLDGENCGAISNMLDMERPQSNVKCPVRWFGTPLLFGSWFNRFRKPIHYIIWQPNRFSIEWLRILAKTWVHTKHNAVRVV